MGNKNGAMAGDTNSKKKARKSGKSLAPKLAQEEQLDELHKEQQEKQIEEIEGPTQEQKSDEGETGAAEGGEENAAVPVHTTDTTQPLIQPVSRSEEEFVGLNVGGVVYVTSRRTLVRSPNSLLGVIFTANVPTPKDNQGNFMIDGDGLMFRHILNYLRRGALSLPNDFQEHQLLKQEAAFYQLPELQGFISNIKPQTLSKAEPTTTTVTTTEPSSRYFVEVYVAEEDDKPQIWRIYGGLNFLEKIPTLSDYLHNYRKGSQCLEITTQHPMFPSNTYRRFPKTTLFFHICSLGFKLHTTDSIKIFDEVRDETSWLRYMFKSSM